MASQRLSALLVLEESRSSRSTARLDGCTGTDSTNEYRQPRLGAPRIHGELGKLGIKCFGDNRRQAHGAAPAPAFRDVAYLLEQSRPGSRLRRFLRSSHGYLPVAVCVRNPFPRPPPAGTLRGHQPSDRGVDGAATLAGVSLGHVSAVSVTRSRRQLRETFRSAAQWLGIEEVLCAPRSPWQNAYAERLIGSIRRECLDHVIVLHEPGP